MSQYTVTYTITTDQDNQEISGEHTVNARNVQVAIDQTENWLYRAYPGCDIVNIQA